MPKVRWRKMEFAPKDGSRVKLYIPYDRSFFTEAECTEEGAWSESDMCWRFDGDDGADDIQPTMWRPIK